MTPSKLQSRASECRSLIDMTDVLMPNITISPQAEAQISPPYPWLYMLETKDHNRFSFIMVILELGIVRECHWIKQCRAAGITKKLNFSEKI